jgi:hypothetical protein
MPLRARERTPLPLCPHSTRGKGLGLRWNDPSADGSDRLEASRLLADRGWGKALASVEIDSRVHHGIETPAIPTITLRGLLDEERLALEPAREVLDAES